MYQLSPAVLYYCGLPFLVVILLLVLFDLIAREARKRMPSDPYVHTYDDDGNETGSFWIG